MDGPAGSAGRPGLHDEPEPALLHVHARRQRDGFLGHGLRRQRAAGGQDLRLVSRDDRQLPGLRKVLVVEILEGVDVGKAPEKCRRNGGEAHEGGEPRRDMEADLHGALFPQHVLHRPAVGTGPPAAGANGRVAVVVVPMRKAVRALVPGELARLDDGRVLGVDPAVRTRLGSPRPLDLFEFHLLAGTAGRAAHPVIEDGLDGGQGLRDVSGLRRGRRELPDLAAEAVRDRPRLGQRDGIGLPPAGRVDVLVDLVADEEADRFVGQPRRAAGPGHVDDHVLQVDAQRRGVVIHARHVGAQPRAALDHGLDAVLAVLLGRQFVRVEDEGRAGISVDGVGEAVEDGLGAAHLRGLADHDLLDGREP